MKKIKIFWKTFILSMIMLCVIVMLAYILLYSLMPGFYQRYQSQKLGEYTSELLKELQGEDPENKILHEFAEKHNVDIKVQDENKSILFVISRNSTYVSFGNEYHEEIIGGSEADENEQASSREHEIESDFGGNNAISLDYTYIRDEKMRTLQIIIPLQPLTEARNVMVSIYPLAILFCIALAFLCSVLLARFIATPIQKMRKAAAKMANLEDDAHVIIAGNDEFGALGKDLNELYDTLKKAIRDLETEMQKASDMENRKLDFLRTVSHELKTPLTSASALIEGIIHKIPPYHGNQERYLLKCKQILDEAARQTKLSLDLSKQDEYEEPENYNLKEIVASVTEAYHVFILSKQISFHQDIPDEVTIRVKHDLFRKALSNIISNAVRYTDKYGKIKVCFSPERLLCIENTCKPIKREEVAQLFEPFRAEHGQSDSNGLGLYIVNQSLSLCAIPFDFKPNLANTGMCFTLYLENTDRADESGKA